MIDESRQSISPAVSFLESEEEIRKESGHRLKTEARKRGLNNSDVAELLKVDVKTVSCYNSGKRRLTEEKAKILADSWGLRAEYLRGISEYDTEEKRFQALREISNAESKRMDDGRKLFFSSCGIETFLVVICDMTHDFFLKHSEQLEQYLPDDFKVPRGDLRKVWFRYRPREDSAGRSLPSVLVDLIVNEKGYKGYIDGTEDVKFEVRTVICVDGEYRGAVPEADFDRFVIRTRAIVRSLAKQFLIPGGYEQTVIDDLDRNHREIY